MTIDALIEEIRKLGPLERHRLIQEYRRLEAGYDPQTSKRSILEFAGVGPEMWNSIDAQDYVDQMRDE